LSRDVKGAGNTTQRKDGRTRLDQLDRQTEHWQTPSASMFEKRRQAGEGRGRDELLLPAQTEQWPTPMGEDARTRPQAFPRGNENRARKSERWSTPTAADSGAKVTENSHQPGLIRDALDFSRLDLEIPPGHGSSRHRLGSRPRLNPAFSAW